MYFLCCLLFSSPSLCHHCTYCNSLLLSHTPCYSLSHPLGYFWRTKRERREGDKTEEQGRLNVPVLRRLMSLHHFTPLFLPSPSVSIYPHHLTAKRVHLMPLRCSHLKVISLFIFVFSIHHNCFSLGSFHQSKCANIFHHSFFLQRSCCSSVLFIPSGVVIFLLPLIFLFVKSHSFHPIIIHLFSL